MTSINSLFIIYATLNNNLNEMEENVNTSIEVIFNKLEDVSKEIRTKIYFKQLNRVS